jgi:3,4-dihydroxy-2-butanone 4-phosphate synthase
MSKSGKSVSIVVFEDRPSEGDLITMGKRGDRYMDQVKESGNMGTGGGTI